MTSLKSLLFLSLLAFRPITAGKLNPLDDDDDEEPTQAAPVPTANPPNPNSNPIPSVDPSKAPYKQIYNCPEDNGLKYITYGITFELKCNFGTAQTHIRHVDCQTQAQCADLCAAEPLCQTSNFNAISKSCGLFPGYIDPVPYANIHTWFPTEKRPDPNEPKPDPVEKAVPLCPLEDGGTYTSEDGTFFKVACGVHTIAESSKATELIRSEKAETFGECMDLCAAEAGCVSVDFVARTGDHVLKTCDLYLIGEGCVLIEYLESVDMAYTIDPPEEDQPDEATLACAFDCPFGNGMIFDSQFGERFHIDCGMRHGSVVIFKDTQESLKDCMDACAALTPCHSVDYHISKKICYYGQHHGEPTNVTPGWASAHSLGCASACSKGGSCGK
ncbi:hypothetical protein B0J14DRAFT_531980 [Halenospora varia]|nr:hypothetical protein B0J14DRAFT_531980 [Halenospora varia]